MAYGQKELTPLMRQYFDIKNNYPDTLLLFQVGDFYELFFEDAQQAAQFLGIALTQRGTTPSGEPIPLCGVPVHVLDHYLTKLIKGGFKVAICDQLETPKPGKIVERDVTQVLTPGTLTDTKLLDAKSASYLCVLFPGSSDTVLVFTELLTGHILTTVIKNTQHQLEAELARFLPDEILLPDTKLGISYEQTVKQLGYAVSREKFQPHSSIEAFSKNSLLSVTDAHLATASESQEVTAAASTAYAQTANWFNSKFTELSCFEQRSELFQSAFIVLFCYLNRTHARALVSLSQLTLYNPEDFLLLDAATQRNLELVKNTQDGTTAHTLFSVLDQAVTSMGSRTLKKWILRPLINQDAVEQRLDVISFFTQHTAEREQVRKLLRSINDLERIVGRIALRRAQLHDYLLLLQALILVPELIIALQNADTIKLLGQAKSKLAGFDQLVILLQQALNQDSSREWIVRGGFNHELDRLRNLVDQGTQAILNLEKKEQVATGISSLKIRFNGAHGYGIEITKANSNLVPAHYMRIQTLVNRERYTTQELKDLEYDLTRSRTDIIEIEKEIFEALKKQIDPWVPVLKKAAQALGHLDALSSLAHVAYTHEYTRPVFNSKRDITIINGRHPVVEQKLKKQFISNNTELTDNASLWIITGPNMGGKSTYLRQVAIISIMAQIGSFVPAQQADLPLIDRIFTRIGAADNMSEGKSTFLVEMEETALICKQATKNSMVILDEVGRGTSTFDGLAIAHAVVEYIYTEIEARCLFATHYHELTALAQQYAHIAPYYAASTKSPNGIVLLHKILPGVADGSFGLEVAKQAQLPDMLLERAYKILENLTRAEKNYVAQHTNISPSQVNADDRYKQLLQQAQELHVYIAQQEKVHERHKYLASQIAQLDPEHLTPKQALDFLWKLKEQHEPTVK